MDAKTTGKIIQQKRKELGLTQIQLAERLGVSNRAVSKWENGDGFPDVSLLEDISSVFDISIDELLTGKVPNNASVTNQEPKEKPKYIINYVVSSIIGFCLLLGSTITCVACEISLINFRPFYAFIEIYLLVGIIVLFILSLIVYLVGFAKYKFEAEQITKRVKLSFWCFVGLSTITPVAIAFRMIRWYSFLLSYIVLAAWLLFAALLIIFSIKRYVKNEKDN